jgi:hypothetical protein
LRRLPAKLANHPSVRAALARPEKSPCRRRPTRAGCASCCLSSGIGDAAAVSLGHPDLPGEREHVLAAFPGAKTLISLAIRMNRDDVRVPVRSVTNHEFHCSGEMINDGSARDRPGAAGRRPPRDQPVRNLPMEMDRLPCRSWVVSHKIVAVARWTRRETHPPKRHPPQVRQLHPAGHAPRRRRSRARAGAGLQPVRWTTTLASNANCVSPACQWAPSARRAISTSARASPTTSGNSRAASQTGCRPWRIARTRPISAPGSPIPKTRRCGRASRSNPAQGQTLYVTEGSPAKEYAERRFPHKPVKEVDSGSPKEG